MKTNSIRYLTKEGFRNIRSNLLMSFVSVTALLVCLLLIGSSLLVFFNFNSFLESLLSQNIVKVFMSNESTHEEIDILAEKLKKTENVESIEFVSPDEAFDAVKQGMDSLEDILDGLDDNGEVTFLPPSFNVTLVDLALYDRSIQEFELFDEVESVRGNHALAANLEMLRSGAIKLSIIFITAFFFASVIIIATTIRITMFSRRLEINIMKAVGATSWFIRWPFLIEGITLGIISSVISYGIIYLIYSFVIASKDSFATLLIDFGGDIVPFSEMSSIITLVFLIIGVFTGTIASSISIGRYLKERGSVIYDENENV